MKCDIGAKCFVSAEPFRVFYRGNLNANVVIVGEGAGKDEMKAAIPFVGKAGMLLTKILHHAGIPLWDVFITNTMACTEDGTQKPTLQIIDNCRPRVFELLEIVQPKLVITLGTFAYECITKQPTFKLTLATIVGEAQHADKFTIVPEYHPAYLLRNPSAKKPAAHRWVKIGDLYSTLIS